MASLKKRAKEFETPYPVTKAITKGNAVTKLSMFVMGLGNLAHKQIVKGILFLAVEIAYLLFMIEGGINNLYHPCACMIDLQRNSPSPRPLLLSATLLSAV